MLAYTDKMAARVNTKIEWRRAARLPSSLLAN
jgi:hypothetical protein